MAATMAGGVAIEGAAPRLQIAFADGHVSLSAHGVTVQQVLQEWERVGRTQVDHPEVVPAKLLDIDLNDVPEEEALGVLLRSAGGFMVTSSPAPSETTSQFGRILIVPPSAPTRETVRAATVQNPPTYFPAAQPVTVEHLIGSDGQPVPDDQDGAPPPRKAGE
jgi:prepilin-type processing-associated H-X9-DG protein